MGFDLPLLEVRVNHPVRESLPTDPDPFKDTVAGQLVHHQLGVDHAGLLVGVGDHAPVVKGLTAFEFCLNISTA